MPEISVIVPVYNVEAYLRECLDSILSQTFSDFELILVDDGSADGSGAICDAYAKTDPRVTAIHQPNAGQAAARNRGVKESKAELLCFIDSDDVAHPALLETFLQTLKSENVGLVTCDRVRGETPPESFFLPMHGETELLEIDESCLMRLLKENSTVYWTPFPCLLRREIYEECPLTPGRVMEDNAVACQWLTAAGRAVVLHSPLYFYRENPTGTMQAPFSEKKLDFLWALEEQLAFYEEKGFYAMQGAVAREYIYSALFLAQKARTEAGDEELARGVIKKAVHVRKRYADRLILTDEETQKLFKAAHPFLHKIRKKLESFKLKP